jgi:hypothetical protein
MSGLRTVAATRYVAPLREGGSLPGLMEADDDNHYVVKFRGAGQGPLALVAEVVCGELARALGLRVPEIVLVEVDPALARAEPDPEIQELIEASGGCNLGIDFLPGALPFTGAARVDPAWAADVVWFDTLVMNVDRTPRNPNLLCWHGDVWLIDHGAALYPQHAAEDLADETERAFATTHVLGEGVSDRLAPQVTRDLVREVVERVPAAWLGGREPGSYVEFLVRRAARGG